MTLSVHGHKFIQRFLQFILSSLESLVFISAALEGNLQILIHFIGGGIVLCDLRFADINFFLQVLVKFLELLQARCQFAILFYHAFIGHLQFYQFFPFRLHLFGRVSFLLNCLHQRFDFIFSLFQLFLVILQLLFLWLSKLNLFLQLFYSFLCAGQRLLIIIFVLQQSLFGLGVSSLLLFLVLL